jgi:hypothetical protein
MVESALATGTYEVLRRRLQDAAEDLRSRFDRLNQARAAVFGSVSTQLAATTHVATDHNCIPRGLLTQGSLLLLGYNVQFGLKTQIEPDDVLSAYQFDGQHARHQSLDFLLQPSFVRDFQELYRYYRGATFSRFFRHGTLVYMVFQIGKSAGNIKAFKWVVDGPHWQYVDSRSEGDVRLPSQHAFAWKRATRESHRQGKHPHISIEDQVFVECVHGDLTIKVEDNTGDGLGIYREPVDSPDQTLDDAETYYAILGHLVLLKIRPYQEKDFRYLVFSTKRSSVHRLDSIGQACALLPDDHGIIFPNGFALQTGVVKQFDHGMLDLSFDQTIRSPNGEDFLYLFQQMETGTYLHLRYNLIRQEVDTPLVCHGQAWFEDGLMLTFRSSDTPQKHHALQLWQTPFSGPDQKPVVQSDSLLFKIGNHDLVRGMAECRELLSLIDKDDSYADLYADMAKRANDLLDGYFWLAHDEAFQISQPITQIRDAATAAIEEYARVVRVRNATATQLQQVEQTTHQQLKSIDRSRFETVEDFVEQLSALRILRGQTIGLRELRYIDLDRVSALENQLVEAADRLGNRCVQFLLAPESLSAYDARLQSLAQSLQAVDSGASAKKLEAEIGQQVTGLDHLIETVSQLKIENLADRTQIVDRIGDCLAHLNRVRASIKARLRELTTVELRADFASQAKLLDQAVASALDTSDTPEKVDAALTRMLLQFEELEGRYADADELVLQLTDKRQSVCELFESHRQHLVEAQTKRAAALVAAADRILVGITTRAARIDDPGELRAYFAADPMVDKVRKLADQLTGLGDTVRRDDVLSRLKSLSDDAVRQQRDRRDLLTDGNRAIRLGHHQFSVHQQSIELTTVVRDGQLYVHLTGTQFYQLMQDPALEGSRDLWDQSLPSESARVYRAEYLAWVLAEVLDREDGVENFLRQDSTQAIAWIRENMQQRYSEGYIRGVHDRDAHQILSWYLHTRKGLSQLAYSPSLRARTWFAWQWLIPKDVRSRLERRLAASYAIQRAMGNHAPAIEGQRLLARYLKDHSQGMLRGLPWSRAGAYLLAELQARFSESVQPSALFPPTQSPRAGELFRTIQDHPSSLWASLQQSLKEHREQPEDLWSLATQAVDRFLDHQGNREGTRISPSDDRDFSQEVAVLLLAASLDPSTNTASEPHAHPMTGPKAKESAKDTAPHPDIVLEGLSGDHALLESGRLRLRFHDYVDRMRHHVREVIPRWQALHATKQGLLEQADQRIKSQEFRPRVLTSFVRNQLIDEVYLPRIGDNLAKQMGALGENKRTDRMGLLLLISPPGYGKTTLMEYIANRLGLAFVKVNGPALGDAVCSLDPTEASNASSREEVQRINMALEMGDNVMLYLDDIQHCHVQLLQKFIPLCDATRRIEGIWDGKPKTYDLRGRKFCMVMAGNPYTESGERFRIPDMLANRADVYNLGEIIGNSIEAFQQSYLENCLTSNPVLMPLARSSHADQRALITASRRGDSQQLTLEGNLSPDSIQEMLQVLSKLQRVRDVVLKMNQEYIRSAAQADDYRTEPPFKLQGSYRNMNRIAEKVVPVMNDMEVEQLIWSSYQQDAQTLSRDSESNLLKFRELLGNLTPEESQRWAAIKKTYVEKNRLHGLSSSDSTGQFLSSLLGLKDGLDAIHLALQQAIAAQKTLDKPGDPSLPTSALPTSVPIEPKLVVQHAVPRVMTDLIRSQFQLLYDGLRPVLESIARQSASNERIRSSLKDLLERYQAMEVATEQSAIVDEEGDPPATN